MSEKERLSQVRELLTQFKKENRLYRLQRTLVKIVTGSFFYWIRLFREEKKLEEVIGKNGDLSFEAKRQHGNWLDVNLSYNYGRKLSPLQKQKIKKLQNDGLTQEEIRLIVVNNILKKDGTLHHSKAIEFLNLWVGILFLLICMVGLALLSGLIWFSAMPVVLKIIIQVFVGLTYFYCGYVMSYFSIIPFVRLNFIRQNT